MSAKKRNVIIVISLVVLVVVTFLIIYYKRKRLVITNEKGETMKEYIFKNTSTAGHLEQIHPKVRGHFADFIEEVESPENGDLEVYVTSSYRSPEKQLEMYNANETPTAISLHNFGFAIDINVNGKDKNGKVVALRMKSPEQDTDLNDFNDWQKIVNIATKHFLSWGGKFTGYADRVHFQYAHSKRASEYLADYNAGKIDSDGFVTTA